jgi:beta-lactamase class A
MRRALLALFVIGLSACGREASQTVVLTPDPQPQQAAPSPAPKTATLVQATPSSTSASTPPASSPAPVVTPPCATTPQPLIPMKPPTPAKVITGRVGLFVGRLSRGTQEFKFDRATWLMPDAQFPLASNFKTSVLYELMRAVDDKKVKLTERFDVTKANRSYGRYPYDNSDVMTLAHAMITWSDNTATDILYRRIGLEALHPLSEELGLCNTRLLLPTKAWWAAQAGYGGADFPKYALVNATRKFALAPFEAQLKMAKRLDAAAQALNADLMRRALDFGYFAGRNGGVETMALIDRQIQNASTPQEWARVLHHAFVTPDLTNDSEARFREVMSHGRGKSFLRVPYRYYGGKSGNTARVLTYSGYLETLSGDRVIYVYMNDSSQNLLTRDETPQAFKLINDALKLVMRPEDLVRAKPTAPIKTPAPAAKTLSPQKP